jgi:hypothetical protein
VFSYENDGKRAGIRPNLEVGKLPSLRIIAIDSLVLHEQPDDDRWGPLKARIESDGLLKHPPIAARDHGSATHILLDGVNRVESLRRLGARWLLVQEVDIEDDSLVLSTWHHVVEGLAGKVVVDRIGGTTGITKIDGEFTSDGDFVPVFGENSECLLVLRDRSVYSVHTASSPRERLGVVRGVVATVHSARNRDRVSYTNMEDLAKHYTDFSALVCYKAFTKEEVLGLSLGGLKFPSGVTRFSVPKRTLYFDLPFSFLKGEGTAESKQAELDDMIQQRIKSKKIRFYVEPTFIFDD